MLIKLYSFKKTKKLHLVISTLKSLKLLLSGLGKN